MKKNFLHVQQMKFLFSTFDDDSYYKNIRKAEHIIQQYDAENKISNLSQNQKNKIDTILIIHD